MFPPLPRGGGLGWGRGWGHTSARGFTLLEVVVAISISAILVGFVAMLVSTPVDAYIDQSERARLTAASETVSRRFADDVRNALPNSVRIRNIGSRSIVEMLRVDAVSFYALAGMTPSPDRDFDAIPDDVFFAFGHTTSIAPYLSVGHDGAGSARDAYAGDDITSSFVRISTGVNGQERIELQGGFAFTSPDPLHRLFWVSGPVAYICDSASNVRTLRRFSNYAIEANIPTSSADLNGATSELIASNVAKCRVECSGPNQNICEDVLVLEANIERPASEARELIRVLEQVALR